MRPTMTSDSIQTRPHIGTAPQGASSCGMHRSIPDMGTFVAPFSKGAFGGWEQLVSVHGRRGVCHCRA
eukprot:m.1327467 g.1327467  ORF g.1327467 m.1327467 type:complete len:68 (+) comp24858_c0_seq31:2908-3111(+)